MNAPPLVLTKEQLRQAIELLGMTHAGLARTIGLSHSTINSMAKGGVGITADASAKIMRLLVVELEKIQQGHEEHLNKINNLVHCTCIH